MTDLLAERSGFMERIEISLNGASLRRAYALWLSLALFFGWVSTGASMARQPGITALSARNGRSSILGVLAASPEIAFAQEVLVSGGLHGVRRPEYRL